MPSIEIPDSTLRVCTFSLPSRKMKPGKEAPMNQIQIGRFIAASRKARNLTQRQLADKLGISDKTVSKWECGVSHS